MEIKIGDIVTDGRHCIKVSTITELPDGVVYCGKLQAPQRGYGCIKHDDKLKKVDAKEEDQSEK